MGYSISEEAKGGRGCSLSRRRHLLLPRSLLSPSAALAHLILASSTSSSFFPSPSLFHYFSILRFLYLSLPSPPSLHSFRQGGTRRLRRSRHEENLSRPDENVRIMYCFLLTWRNSVCSNATRGVKRKRGAIVIRRLESTRSRFLLRENSYPKIDIKLAPTRIEARNIILFSRKEEE